MFRMKELEWRTGPVMWGGTEILFSGAKEKGL